MKKGREREKERAKVRIVHIENRKTVENSERKRGKETLKKTKQKHNKLFRCM